MTGIQKIQSTGHPLGTDESDRNTLFSL